MAILIALQFQFLIIQAQDMTGNTRVSQRASVTQRIGTSDVTIVYHSPQTKGRKIFGGIVPYDFVVDGKEYAWRAGSNQRTTIEFSHDVTIEGKPLAAGSYGFVVLVSKEEWVLVFSNDKTWGAFQYDPKDDVLRVPVKTETVPHQEWLSYRFINPQAGSAEVELRWERTRVRFEVATNVSDNLVSDLMSKEEKTTRDYRTIAMEIYRNDRNRADEALEWVEKGLAVLHKEEGSRHQVEEFTSNIFKADLLIAMGRTKEGEPLRKKTLASAEGFNMYYYGLSPILLDGDKEKSYKLLTDYAKKKPEDYVAHLALGEYYLKVGDQAKVVEHFKKAFEYAPERSKNYARYLYLQNKLVLERSN